MQLPKPSESGSFELTPAGTFLATCYRFIDRGTHASEYMGDKKIRREVMLSWELDGELMSDGRPFSASKTYTWSMHEKATLRKDLESWRGKAFVDEDFDGPTAFNVKKLIGVSCMMTITHETRDGKTFAKVASIGKLMRGMTPPALINKPVYLALTPDEWDAEAYGTLSDKMKMIISESPEYKEIMAKGHRSDDPGNGHYTGHAPDDDMPF